ncbi:MAG: hypothetical protein JWN24_379 [Phycisphaerales bacterium]|nr:hypothetical protein [Phycisphaerales bacterium]
MIAPDFRLHLRDFFKVVRSVPRNLLVGDNSGSRRLSLRQQSILDQTQLARPVFEVESRLTDEEQRFPDALAIDFD